MAKCFSKEYGNKGRAFNHLKLYQDACQRLMLHQGRIQEGGCGGCNPPFCSNFLIKYLTWSYLVLTRKMVPIMGRASS